MHWAPKCRDGQRDSAWLRLLCQSGRMSSLSEPPRMREGVHHHRLWVPHRRGGGWELRMGKSRREKSKAFIVGTCLWLTKNRFRHIWTSRLFWDSGFDICLTKFLRDTYSISRNSSTEGHEERSKAWDPFCISWISVGLKRANIRTRSLSLWQPRTSDRASVTER